MHITDPVADMLTRIRNANSAKHDTVDVPASNMKKSIAQILLDEGYIKGFTVVDDAAPRAPRPGYRHHLHFQGRHDRQGCPRGPCRWRSPGIRLVRRVFEQCLELAECPLPSPPASP